jgi:hypothetical protein
MCGALCPQDDVQSSSSDASLSSDDEERLSPGVGRRVPAPSSAPQGTVNITRSTLSTSPSQHHSRVRHPYPPPLLLLCPFTVVTPLPLILPPPIPPSLGAPTAPRHSAPSRPPDSSSSLPPSLPLSASLVPRPATPLPPSLPLSAPLPPRPAAPLPPHCSRRRAQAQLTPSLLAVEPLPLTYPPPPPPNHPPPLHRSPRVSIPFLYRSGPRPPMAARCVT